MLKRLLSKEFRRKRALARATHPVMQEYLSASLPHRDTLGNALEIVSIDLETTGLDPKQDSLLSFGLVNLWHHSIQLKTAWHEIVRIQHNIPESSAVIHHITDDQAAEGTPLDILLPKLLQRLKGKVMLVHYADIEQNFLDAACRELYGSPFIISTIDTLQLAQRLLSKRNHSTQPGDLRLFNLRPIFGLPMYKAHNALYDALATAELFLAISRELQPKGKFRLKDFLS
jgi:DNA polymerase-3 subunit epsilon